MMCGEYFVRDLKIPDQRHPEKAHRPDNAQPKKPDWIRVKAPTGKGYRETHKIMRDHNLVTVCEEAGCPNAGVRHRSPGTTIEILTPDFLHCESSVLETVVAAKPDVFNHNLETVPSLYPSVRPGARYFHSLRLLQRVKEIDPTMFTKSGIMVGLGENRPSVHQVMDDMRAADIDFLTIGQYLQPSPKHHAVDRFVHPDEFAAYEKAAYGKGFLMVSATPLTRSSYHAGDDFARLREARLAKLG